MIMKTFRFLTILAIGVSLSLSAFSQEKFGKVYFIRSTGFQGSAAAFTAFIDNQLVCKLNNKRYSIHEVPVGEHTFTVQFGGKQSKAKAEPIVINVEEGKSYYVQMIFQTGALKNNLYCQEVTENSANTIMVNCVEDTKCFPDNYEERMENVITSYSIHYTKLYDKPTRPKTIKW